MIDYTIEEGDYDALIFRDERRFVKAVVGLSQDEEGKYESYLGYNDRHFPSLTDALAFTLGYLSKTAKEGEATFNGKTAEEFLAYASKIINPQEE